MTFGYREFLVPGFFSFFWWYRNRYRKKLVPDIVLEPVSKKIGTGKSLGTNIGKTWYRKKVSEPVSVKFAKILDIYNGIGTGTGNFSFLLVVSEPVSE